MAIFRTVIGLSLSLVLMNAAARAESIASSTRAAILSDAGLLRVETAREAAYARLLAQPHSALVSVLRTELHARTGKDRDMILNAIGTLRLEELFGDCLLVAQSAKTWPAYSALNSLATGEAQKTQVNQFAFERLKSDRGLPLSVRHALIDGLALRRVPLSSELYDRLLADPSPIIRDAVVLEFIASRTKLSDDEQARRFRKAFAIDPYQARLDAYLGFGDLPMAERKKLASAFDGKRCLSETQAQVKKACTAISFGGVK